MKKSLAFLALTLVASTANSDALVDEYVQKRLIQTAERYGTCVGSEQTEMLMRSDEGLRFPSILLQTTAKRYGTHLNSQQTQMLMEQDSGLLWNEE